MKPFIYISTLCVGLAACSGSDIKEKINKAGDVAGQTAGEFIEGASKGVKKAFDVKVEMQPELKNKGLEFGKTTITSDTIGEDNLLLLYVIFNQDFTDSLTAKIYDEQMLEMGRAHVAVSAKKGEAKFVEFRFGKHSDIDSKNKITIE